MAPTGSEQTPTRRFLISSSLVDLAQQIFIAHAAPGSETEAFAHKLAATGKSLLTLDGPANANLVGLGARLVRTQRITRD